MDCIITLVSNVAFGMVLRKVRDHTAKRLKEGDVNHEECRQLILRELCDIRTKLDDLARMYLLCSVNFLDEGIRALNFGLGESSYPEEQGGDGSEAEASTMTDTGKLEHAEQSAINQTWPLCSTISLAISRLSEDSLVSAKASFKTAQEEATRAFSNEALSTEDRILATKLRVTSRILEGLENLDAAADACMGYLQALHDMPAIRKTFSVYLYGGRIKANHNKTKRLEHVMSVTMINFVLFHFICQFTKISQDLLNWPRIEIAGETYHPIIANRNILENMKPADEALLSNQIITSETRDFTVLFDFIHVNSKREIVACMMNEKVVMVYNTTTCKWRLLCKLLKEMTGATGVMEIQDLVIGGDDDVYIIAKSNSKDGKAYHLFVFNANGKLKYQSSLEQFLDGKEVYMSAHNISLVLTTDGRIIIFKFAEMRMLVLDHTGQLKHDVCLRDIQIPIVLYMCVTDKNDIIFAPLLSNSMILEEENSPKSILYIFTEEGKLKRRIETTAEAKDVRGVAFNHITKTVMQLEKGFGESYSLSSHSITGEKRYNLELPHWIRYPKLTSHPSGAVALVHQEGVIFIR